MVIRTISFTIQLHHQVLEERGEFQLGVFINFDTTLQSSVYQDLVPGRKLAFTSSSNLPFMWSSHWGIPDSCTHNTTLIITYQDEYNTTYLFRFRSEELMRYEDTKLSLPFHWTTNSLLDFQSLAHNSRIQFLLKSEQVHIGLRFRN